MSNLIAFRFELEQNLQSTKCRERNGETENLKTSNNNQKHSENLSFNIEYTRNPKAPCMQFTCGAETQLALCTVKANVHFFKYFLSKVQ